jgi:hypothetical protein
MRRVERHGWHRWVSGQRKAWMGHDGGECAKMSGHYVRTYPRVGFRAQIDPWQRFRPNPLERRFSCWVARPIGRPLSQHAVEAVDAAGLPPHALNASVGRPESVAGGGAKPPEAWGWGCNGGAFASGPLGDPEGPEYEARSIRSHCHCQWGPLLCPVPVSSHLISSHLTSSHRIGGCPIDPVAGPLFVEAIAQLCLRPERGT